MDAGTLLILLKPARPVSLLFMLILPVGPSATSSVRPKPRDPSEIPVCPASRCVNSGGRVETAGTQAAPLGSIEIVARLLTKLPICTTTGIKHPVTPSGIVKRMTSQAAIPCGIRKAGSRPSQQTPRLADTTVAGLTPAY